MELGSAPASTTFVPMPRMVTCASPVCCETVSVGTKPARPSTVVTPNCSSVLAGSAVTAIGVLWMSAAPVFVAVTVTRSPSKPMASTTSSVATPASISIVVVRGSNPLEEGLDHVAADGKVIELVAATVACHAPSGTGQSRASDSHRHP